MAGALERRAASPYVQSWLRGDDLPNAWGPGGQPVYEDGALGIAALYACVSRISEALATVPGHVYQRLEPRGRKRATGHWAYPRLHGAPNREMTAVNWREAMVGHVCTWGNAFSEIVRDQGDRPMAFWPLRPDRMKLQRDTAGQLWYVYRTADNQPRMFPARDILHFRGLSSNGIIGYNLVDLLQQSLGEAISTETYAARFWANGSTPGGILKTDAQLSPEAAQRLKESWEAAHRGAENAWRVAVLEDGVEWQTISLPMDSAQFMESRKFKRSEIAGVWNVPAHKIGDLEHATFSNIEHQNIDWVISTIRPWAVRFETEINRQVLRDDPTYYFEFDLDGLLRGDLSSRYQAYNTGRMAGFLSANDIREKENLNPLPGQQGDVYWAPLNMTSAEDLANNDTNGNTGQSGARALERRAAGDGSAANRLRLGRRYRRLLVDAAQRIVRREIGDVRSAAERIMPRRDALGFVAWADEYYRDTLPSAAERAMLAAVLTYAHTMYADAQAEINASGDELPAELEQFLRAYVASFAQAWAGRSLGQLRQIVRQAIEDGEDPLDGITTRLDEWDERRADKTADVESTRITGAVTIWAWKRAGVRRIVWVAQGSKTCPYCQTLDGRTVGIEQNFLSDGEAFDAEDADGPLTPTSDIRHPPAHGTCVCGLAPA